MNAKETHPPFSASPTSVMELQLASARNTAPGPDFPMVECNLHFTAQPEMVIRIMEMIRNGGG